MAERVAVEDGLTPVRELLAARGYEVVDLRPATRGGVVAVVLNGMDDNVTGRTDRLTPAPVIDAAGLTPDEVLEAVRRQTSASRRNPTAP